MSWFTRVARPARSGRSGRSFRTTLRLEELGLRATPSSMDDTQPTPLPGGSPPALENPPPPGNPTPTQTAPNIDRFVAVEVAHGWYQISGHVTAAAPGGLTVSFDGIPALEGMSTGVSYILTTRNRLVGISEADFGPMAVDDSPVYDYLARKRSPLGDRQSGPNVIYGGGGRPLQVREEVRGAVRHHCGVAC